MVSRTLIRGDNILSISLGKNKRIVVLPGNHEAVRGDDEKKKELHRRGGRDEEGFVLFIIDVDKDGVAQSQVLYIGQHPTYDSAESAALYLATHHTDFIEELLEGPEAERFRKFLIDGWRQHLDEAETQGTA